MTKYLEKVKLLIAQLQFFEISHVPRTKKTQADALSHLATSCSDALGRTYVEYLKNPSITGDPPKVEQVTQETNWRDPFVTYLTDGILPENEDEAHHIQWTSAQYILLGGSLYKRSFTQPLLKCIGPTDVDYALREVYEGIHRDHLGGRALAYKILCQGYYWPTIQKDAIDLIKRCNLCQRYANIQRRLATQLTPLTVPWQFAQ